jgi:methyltransferase-like protein
MADLKKVISRSGNIVSRRTGSEYVLVPVTNNIADMNSVYTINESGAFIWEHIDGKRNVEELVNVLMDEYEIDFKTAAEDVMSFIERMKEFLVIETA